MGCFNGLGEGSNYASFSGFGDTFYFLRILTYSSNLDSPAPSPYTPLLSLISLRMSLSSSSLVRSGLGEDPPLPTLPACWSGSLIPSPLTAGVGPDPVNHPDIALLWRDTSPGPIRLMPGLLGPLLPFPRSGVSGCPACRVAPSPNVPVV